MRELIKGIMGGRKGRACGGEVKNSLGAILGGRDRSKEDRYEDEIDKEAVNKENRRK